MSSGDHSGAERDVRRPPVPRAEDIPIVSDVHATWTRFNDPAAKLERRKRRTSRALTLWVLLTMICGLFAVTGYAGLLSAASGLAGAFSGILGILAFGTLGVRSGIRLRTLHHTPLPASTVPAPLPPVGSLAREPMRRLAESEDSLTELLARLEEPAYGLADVSGTVPEISVADARSTAEEASTALRGLGARIQAIERARSNAPAGEQGALDSAATSVAEQLDDGLDGYGSLVAAAGRAVAASSGSVEPAKRALTEATDHLAGLAIALRELS